MLKSVATNSVQDYSRVLSTSIHNKSLNENPKIFPILFLIGISITVLYPDYPGYKSSLRSGLSSKFDNAIECENYFTRGVLAYIYTLHITYSSMIPAAILK
uniref:Uncharacterized protein n=1 Tax=Cacopsylla melanoneura TaxID=428564 RepID=A0A8D8YI09_9HEMI